MGICNGWTVRITEKLKQERILCIMRAEIKRMCNSIRLGLAGEVCGRLGVVFGPASQITHFKQNLFVYLCLFVAGAA